MTRISAAIVLLLISQTAFAHPQDNAFTENLRKQLDELQSECAKLRLENTQLRKRVVELERESVSGGPDETEVDSDKSDLTVSVNRTQVIGLTVAEEQRRSALRLELNDVEGSLIRQREHIHNIERQKRSASSIGREKAVLVKLEGRERRLKRDVAKLERVVSLNRMLIDAALVDGSGHVVQILVVPPLTDHLGAIPVGSILKINARPLFIEPGRTGYRATSIVIDK